MIARGSGPVTSPKENKDTLEKHKQVVVEELRRTARQLTVCLAIIVGVLNHIVFTALEVD